MTIIVVEAGGRPVHKECLIKSYMCLHTATFNRNIWPKQRNLLNIKEPTQQSSKNTYYQAVRGTQTI